MARLQAALDGLGLDGSHRLIIVLMQLVNLLQDGQPVRMSKRSGKAIALRDLLDEVSVDAARFFFNSRSSPSALDFDLDLAVREDSENPVYYVQYAHARICSLIARLAEEGHLVPDAAAVDPALYATAEEKALIKTLSQLPEVIRLAARDYDPSGVNRYLVTLAGSFTASTMPAVSRVRRRRCSPPASSWPTRCAPSSPTAWPSLAWRPRRKCNNRKRAAPGAPGAARL